MDSSQFAPEWTRGARADGYDGRAGSRPGPGRSAVYVRWRADIDATSHRAACDNGDCFGNRDTSTARADGISNRGHILGCHSKRGTHEPARHLGANGNTNNWSRNIADRNGHCSTPAAD